MRFILSESVVRGTEAVFFENADPIPWNHAPARAFGSLRAVSLRAQTATVTPARAQLHILLASNASGSGPGVARRLPGALEWHSTAIEISSKLMPLCDFMRGAAASEAR